MDTKVLAAPRRRTRRHSPDFKARVIAACLEPGVSLAAVALANGLNANFLRTWVKAYRKQQEPGEVPAIVNRRSAELATRSTPTLVPVSTPSLQNNKRRPIRHARTNAAAALPCRPNCRASNTGTNPNPAPAAPVVGISSRLARTSANNSTLNRRASLFIAISGLSTPAGRAKPSLPHRCPLR